MVVGLSMGGALTRGLAAEHPEIAGIVLHQRGRSRRRRGWPRACRRCSTQGQRDDGRASARTSPTPTWSSWPTRRRRSRPLLTLFEAADELRGPARAGSRCPVLVMTSPQDHVVPPENSDLIAEGVAGPVERVTLERSYHVATLDYDRDLVEAKTVEFVTAAFCVDRSLGSRLPTQQRVWGVGGAALRWTGDRPHHDRRRRPRRPPGPADADRRRARHLHRAARRGARPRRGRRGARPRRRAADRPPVPADERAAPRRGRPDASTATRCWPRRPRSRTAASGCRRSSARRP